MTQRTLFLKSTTRASTTGTQRHNTERNYNGFFFIFSNTRSTGKTTMFLLLTGIPSLDVHPRFSRPSLANFTPVPPPYPPKVKSERTTLWQGTIGAKGFAAITRPTALALPPPVV